MQRGEEDRANQYAWTGYRRFLENWVYAHNSDRDFQGVPFPPNHFELPSPQILPGQTDLGLPSPEWQRNLEPVQEPAELGDDDRDR